MPTSQREKGTEKKTRILQQKKDKYKKNKQLAEQRARLKRKQEKADNAINDRRLSFLTNIIYSRGYNMKRIAEMIGTTQQAMSWCFSVKDDCRLSFAEEILGVLGLKLSVLMKSDGKIPAEPLPEEELKGMNNGVRFSLEGDIAKTIQRINPKMPDYVNECTADKRMYWLAKFLPTVNIPITEMMKRCDFDLSSLRYIFIKDDIKISQIFKIAKGTGADIIWNISNKA